MREIVTIQVGGFANFVGCHFWNFQDELLGLAEDPHGDPIFKNQCVDMDVLYRTGETQQGILTYTPRMLSVGVPGSLGTLSSRSALYNHLSSPSSPVGTWMGNVSTHVSEPHKKNLFLQRLHEEEQEKPPVTSGVNSGKDDPLSDISDKDVIDSLENNVQFWTDFSKVHYHPQSLYELNGLWMDAQNFDNYEIGKDAFVGSLHGEEINERLRFFVEECDHIQGIKFVVDDSGGFSSVAAEFLQNIADEYTNTPVLLFSVRSPSNYLNPRSQKHMMARNLHDAVSFSTLSSFCKLIVPVGLPTLSRSKASSFLCVQDEKPYHCSAVYGAALHSASLPFRMEPVRPTKDSLLASGAMDIHGIIQMLAGQTRQNSVAILDIAMPAPSLTGISLKHLLDSSSYIPPSSDLFSGSCTTLLPGQQFERSLLGSLHSLTPETAEDVEDSQCVESLIIHGALGSASNRASIDEVKDCVDAVYEHAISRPMYSHLSVAGSPLPIPLPFPSIFNNLVGQHGELLGGRPAPDSSSSSSSSRGPLDVQSIPMAARLRSSSAVLPFLESRLGNLRRLGIQRGAPGSELLTRWGFGKEDVEDMGETLFGLVQKLHPESLGSSDSD